MLDQSLKYYQSFIEKPQVFQVLRNLNERTQQTLAWPSRPTDLLKRYFDVKLQEELLSSKLIRHDQNLLDYYLYYFPVIKLQKASQQEDREKILKDYNRYFEQKIKNRGLAQLQLNDFLSCHTSVLNIQGLKTLHNGRIIVQYQQDGQKLSRNFIALSQRHLSIATIDTELSLDMPVDLGAEQEAKVQPTETATVTQTQELPSPQAYTDSSAEQLAQAQEYFEPARAAQAQAHAQQQATQRQPAQSQLKATAFKYSAGFIGGYSGVSLYVSLFT